jgi:hypothetical protein
VPWKLCDGSATAGEIKLGIAACAPAASLLDDAMKSISASVLRMRIVDHGSGQRV